MSNTKKKKTFFSVMGDIASYIVYPVILIAILSAFLVSIITPSGKLPQIFGLSIVQIQSSSMKEAGFEVKDVAFVSQNVNGVLKKGDIVAFYKIFDDADAVVRQNLVLYDDWDKMTTGENQIIGTRITRQTVENGQNMIFFHYVNNVFVSPSDGTIFYETKGSNEHASPDGFIRADFVVGTYLYTPTAVRRVMSFATSNVGMILLIALPLCVLVFLECLGLIEQLNKYGLEKKIFNRQIPFDSKEAEKYNIGKEMEIARKIYFYLTASEDEKSKVFNFLFASLKDGDKKEKQTYEDALEASEKKSSDEYFNFWRGRLVRNYDKKELIKLQNQYNYEILVKNNNGKDKI